MVNNTQEMDDSAIMGEDDRQAQKIYHTQNCYMDSLNDRNFQMLNCGNENCWSLSALRSQYPSIFILTNWLDRRTTVIDHAKTTNKDELPHPQPCEASTGSY